MMLDESIYHQILKGVIPKSEGTYRTQFGTIRDVRTTKDWDTYVRWKDRSIDWIALKDFKDSYPIELAEYAVTNNIDKEAAFSLWIPFVIKKRHCIISKLKSKYWKMVHTYGIKIPKTME